jgi:nucleotide-binding universal stress UspA family protein
MAQEIERIVVPLDAPSETATAIDTAVRLAARWGVPVHGVFIEDEELIGLAGLPFARQVTLGAGAEPLTRDQVEDHFRAAAERARRELAAAAEQHDVNWSFEVARGPLRADMFAEEHDLVVAGATTRPVGAYFRLSSRYWSWMGVAARPFLLAKRAWETGGSVFTLLRGRGPQSAQTLGIAAQIAGSHSRTLTVAGAFDPAPPDDFAAWVSGLLEGHSLNLQTEPEALEPAALPQRILELDCRLLVLEAGEQDGRTEELRELVEHLTCDVLIVR